MGTGRVWFWATAIAPAAVTVLVALSTGMGATTRVLPVSAATTRGRPSTPCFTLTWAGSSPASRSWAASHSCWRKHPSPDPTLALRLLALLFLIRCLLDPLSISYHHVPFLLALTAAEATARQRLPKFALAVVAISLVMSKYLHSVGPDGMNRVYLSWSVPIALYLAHSLFVSGRVRGFAHLRAPVLSPDAR